MTELIFDFAYFHGNEPEAKHRRITKELYRSMSWERKFYFAIYALERIPFTQDKDLRNWFMEQFDKGNMKNIVEAMIPTHIHDFINDYDMVPHYESRDMNSMKSYNREMI